MINKILIIVSVILILLGLGGAKTKIMKKKLLFLCISTIGMVMLPVSLWNLFGVKGGLRQAVFQLPALLCFVLLFYNICKKNELTSVEELAGMRQRMPFLYTAAVIFAVVLAGFPTTGSFYGIMYSLLGLLGGDFGICTYLGMLGVIAGIAISVMLTFSILKHAYLSGDAELKSPSKGFAAVMVVMALLFVILCIFQNQAMSVIDNPIEKIFS